MILRWQRRKLYHRYQEGDMIEAIITYGEREYEVKTEQDSGWLDSYFKSYKFEHKLMIDFLFGKLLFKWVDKKYKRSEL